MTHFYSFANGMIMCSECGGDGELPEDAELCVGEPSDFDDEGHSGFDQVCGSCGSLLFEDLAHEQNTINAARAERLDEVYRSSTSREDFSERAQDAL